MNIPLHEFAVTLRFIRFQFFNKSLAVAFNLL